MFKPGATLTVDNATATLAAGLQAIAGGQSAIDLSGVATLLAWQRAAKQKGLALQFGVLPANLQSLVDLYGAASLLGAPTSASDRHH